MASLAGKACARSGLCRAVACEERASSPDLRPIDPLDLAGHLRLGIGPEGTPPRLGPGKGRNALPGKMSIVLPYRLGFVSRLRSGSEKHKGWCTTLRKRQKEQSRKVAEMFSVNHG